MGLFRLLSGGTDKPYGVFYYANKNYNGTKIKEAQMGYMVHHTIVLTSWDDKLLRKTWRKAREIFANTNCYITNLTPIVVNNNHSYFIAPDGSKRGWEASQRGFEARKEFIAYLKELKPYPPDWALIQYGDEEGDDRLVESNHKRCRISYAE